MLIAMAPHREILSARDLLFRGFGGRRFGCEGMKKSFERRSAL